MPALGVAELGSAAAYAQDSAGAYTPAFNAGKPNPHAPWVVGDVKRAMEHLQDRPPRERLRRDNYKQVIDGLKEKLKVNALRVPILKSPPASCGPTQPGRRGMPEHCYGDLYADIINYAQSKGLEIHASPMETGKQVEGQLRDPKKYVTWVAQWQNSFNADFVSPFNENGVFTPSQKVSITKQIKSRLAPNHQALFVGPDTARLDDSLEDFEGEEGKGYSSVFDIVSAHGATKAIKDMPPGQRHSLWPDQGMWEDFNQEVRDPVWAGEVHGGWSRVMPGGHEIGLKATCSPRGPQGRVLYKAYPDLVGGKGNLTKAGSGVARHLTKIPGENHTRCVQ